MSRERLIYTREISENIVIITRKKKETNKRFLKDFLRDLNFLITKELSRVLLTAILILANRLIIIIAVDKSPIERVDYIQYESILRNEIYHKFSRVIRNAAAHALRVCNIRNISPCNIKKRSI